MVVVVLVCKDIRECLLFVNRGSDHLFIMLGLFCLFNQLPGAKCNAHARYLQLSQSSHRNGQHRSNSPNKQLEILSMWLVINTPHHPSQPFIQAIIFPQRVLWRIKYHWQNHFWQVSTRAAGGVRQLFTQSLFSHFSGVELILIHAIKYNWV